MYLKFSMDFGIYIYFKMAGLLMIAYTNGITQIGILSAVESLGCGEYDAVRASFRSDLFPVDEKKKDSEVYISDSQFKGTHAINLKKQWVRGPLYFLSLGLRRTRARIITGQCREEVNDRYL